MVVFVRFRFFVPSFLIDIEFQKIPVILTDYSDIHIAFIFQSPLSPFICALILLLCSNKKTQTRELHYSRIDFQKPSRNITVVLWHNDEVQADLSAGVVLGIIWREDNAVRACVLTATGCCKRKSRRDHRVHPYQSLPWNTSLFPAALKSARAL